ncbi:MAG: cell division protein ZapA [Proteobacteria bacterium]|nr:cell division protein ZapA [Desulfobulbaceae bacterium]MBU4152372.1 cell division protein ZapA [Pseudomonadota bacterium]
MERLVKFEIFGQEYPLHTDAPEEDVREILDLVKSQMELHAKSAKILPVKIAVLVTLNMAAKYVRLKRDHERLKQKENNAISQLISQIERCIK